MLSIIGITIGFRATHIIIILCILRRRLLRRSCLSTSLVQVHVLAWCFDKTFKGQSNIFLQPFSLEAWWRLMISMYTSLHVEICFIRVKSAGHHADL